MFHTILPNSACRWVLTIFHYKKKMFLLKRFALQHFMLSLDQNLTEVAIFLSWRCVSKIRVYELCFKSNENEVITRYLYTKRRVAVLLKVGSFETHIAFLTVLPFLEEELEVHINEFLQCIYRGLVDLWGRQRNHAARSGS